MEEQFLDAVEKRDFNKVNTLIKDGADVNFEHDTGMTALSWAQSENDLEMAELLLKNHADLNYRYKTEKFKTVVQSAALDEQLDMLKLFLKYKPDLNIRDGFGNNALWSACYTNNLEIIELLLKHGADAYTKNKVGEILVGKKKQPMGVSHSPYSLALEDENEEQLNLFEKYKNG
ncbi:ankyrin repeat domain-containing protein [Pedobacter sp. MR2016-19]|uniref:ankyrin repeat domain-containing protein n=1 Tax=Pedobacter sp. MR2016-19 TaxID=2780089 RepID=UPI0018751F3B|nr:ankyrin repeat domain-containing protein [Pedobacter sp. MR2016-19]MBE5322128.1 ankyrin repeat domain-containing protein [Pedobacter sp. MR2016-19]